MFIPGASQKEHWIFRASFPVSSPTLFIKSKSKEDAKAVEHGHPVEPKLFSDCLSQIGRAHV